MTDLIPKVGAGTGGRRQAVVTIREVARQAEVSIGTASKALNGQGQLRPETRQRVIQIAERLGFRPNDLAQSLTRGRSFTVGLLTTDSYGRFSIPLMTGIEDALGPSQIAVFLCDARDSREREQMYIRSLLSKRVDGIIVTSRRTDPREAIDLGTSDVPVLYAYAQVEGGSAPCILPDDVQGGRIATEHLLRCGRRQLAHITGPMRFLAARERLEGMRSALAEADLPLPEGRVLSGPWDERWAYEAAGKLIDSDPGIDGIFAGNDQLARGVLDALRERSVLVPSDVSVVGFDNWEVIAGSTRPLLTTIDMDLPELGRYAGMRLLAMIASERVSGTVHLPCRLVIRESCGARTSESRVEEGGDATGS